MSDVVKITTAAGVTVTVTAAAAGGTGIGGWLLMGALALGTGEAKRLQSEPAEAVPANVEPYAAAEPAESAEAAFAEPQWSAANSAPPPVTVPGARYVAQTEWAAAQYVVGDHLTLVINARDDLPVIAGDADMVGQCLDARFPNWTADALAEDYRQVETGVNDCLSDMHIKVAAIMIR